MMRRLNEWWSHTGASLHSEDGGDGGNVKISGGSSLGTNRDDAGGDVEVRGGSAVAGYGGSLRLASGRGLGASSGSVVIETANGGAAGSSGSLGLATGRSP